MRKYSKIIVLLFAIVLLTSGCGADPNQAIDPNNGIWDKFFVYPLSLTIEFFADLFNSYGISIIVSTILVRTLVLPLMIKQIKGSKAMQELQPQMKEIKEKYKDNPQKVNEETMKLFQTKNVNPMSGCLPIFIQMPILIAFYHAIMRNPNIAADSFLWFDLGQPDILYLFGIPIPILSLLAALTTYLSTKAMSIGTTAMTPQQAQQQKLMAILMPAMIFFFSLNFASALTLYWVTGNTYTIFQNKFIRGKK